ncbi:hypothetical protein F5B21DRAFT_510107 [Xylaria acuta]|nr:hypothetical protein F5B21DRAFT_510107 [Xylaria acuta]
MQITIGEHITIYGSDEGSQGQRRWYSQPHAQLTENLASAAVRTGGRGTRVGKTKQDNGTGAHTRQSSGRAKSRGSSRSSSLSSSSSSSSSSSAGNLSPTASPQQRGQAPMKGPTQEEVTAALAAQERRRERRRARRSRERTAAAAAAVAVVAQERQQEQQRQNSTIINPAGTGFGPAPPARPHPGVIDALLDQFRPFFQLTAPPPAHPPRLTMADLGRAHCQLMALWLEGNLSAEMRQQWNDCVHHAVHELWEAPESAMWLRLGIW